MHSTFLYNLSTLGYVFSLFIFAFQALGSRKALLRMGVLLLASSFIVQTSGMVLRWIEAGRLEVLAAERAVGQVLSGWSYFVIFTQHPPWSNLYEIMIYMSWGIIMVTMAAELKWQLSWLRQMGIMLALMALGMASLTDASIKPLVPALKSWWIMIHVISASIAYAAGAIAAFISLFALMKDDVRVKKCAFMGCAFIAVGILLFSLAGGPRLVLEQTYFVKLLGSVSDNVVSVIDMSKDGGVPFLVPMPFMGWIFIITIFIHLVLGAALIQTRALAKDHIVRLFALIGFVFSTICLAGVTYHDLMHTSIDVGVGLSHHLSPPGPWFISSRSHPWSLGLLVFTLVMEAWLLLYILRPKFIADRLPSVAVLENAAYKAISLSFFLVTLVLITGALWAHYAWGRYWAWDPKETGALAIWLTYAIYLHARRTSKLSHVVCSVIGVVGFFVIIIGFLGVNLGLFANGLHTYGNS